MRQLLLALAIPFLALTGQPAVAQDAVSSTAPAPVDAARLAAARIAVGHVFPAGTYARLMNGNMTVMLDSMVKTSGSIPLREAAALAGESPAELNKLGKTTISDIMTILDPAYDQRMGIVMHTTMAEMTRIMTELEPGIREGMAEAYARRFTAAQLADINRFFDSPTGQAYAANVMTIQADPAVLSRMQAIVPVVMQRLPSVMEQASQATAKLPPPRKFNDLSPAERTKLASLLGVPQATLAANAQAKK